MIKVNILIIKSGYCKQTNNPVIIKAIKKALLKKSKVKLLIPFMDGDPSPNQLLLLN